MKSYELRISRIERAIYNTIGDDNYFFIFEKTKTNEEMLQEIKNKNIRITMEEFLKLKKEKFGERKIIVYSTNFKFDGLIDEVLRERIQRVKEASYESY